MTNSINELKSYTEYNVNAPTSVFTIGFQYEHNVDHVNVYVDGVEAIAAGYTIQHDSQGTVTLTPAVPSGVVRLIRETAIDTSAHTFSAGAKFTAGNMDENFQQIRHSQQEVRDGFNKVSTDVYKRMDGFDGAIESAQDAAKRAKADASVAQEAANTVNTIIVGGKVSANNVIDAGGRSQQAINLDRINIKDYGAIGDGTLHTLQEWVDSGKYSNLAAIQIDYEFATSLTNSIDYVAVAQALKFANSKVRTGLVSSIKNSGACVLIPAGEYNMQGITQAFHVMCNIKNDGAGFLIPSDYAGTVFNVGSFTDVENLAKADIELPDVYKTVSNNPLLTGSCGVRVGNLNASRLVVGRISYFEDGLWLGGVGEGTVYNDIYLGQINYCKKLIKIVPGSGGWCNANRIYGGNLHQSAGFAGGIRSLGWSFLFIDGRSPATAVVGNNFFGTSFEGNAADYAFDFYGAYGNNFIGCYHETGAPFNPVTVSGDTLTHTGHTLVVGDQIAFIASTLPTGMLDNNKYYVVSVSGDTFKVSKNRSGAAETFASSGSNVRYILSARFRFNQPVGGALCYDNKIINVFAPPSIFLDIVQTGQAQNNGVESPSAKIVEAYNPNNAPPYRSRNSVSGLNRPIYAAYKYDIKITENPDLWSTALTSEGVAYRENGADLGYLSNSSGVLKYKRPSDARAYDIASCTRSPSLLDVNALSVPANGRAIATLTLTGAAVGELVVVTPYSALVDGVAIAWCRVSAANTVQVCFNNWTANAISLTAQFHAMAVRNYY